MLPRSGCRYNTVNWIRQGEEENILEVGPRSRKVSGKPGIVGILFARDHEVDSPGIPPPGERLIWLQASYRNIFVLFGKIRRIAAGFICSNDLKAYRVGAACGARVCAGVPPSTVDAQMIEPRMPGGKGNVRIPCT